MRSLVVLAAILATTGAAGAQTLPAGHPQVDPQQQQQQQPRANPNVFRPPPDTSNEESSLPAGTIRVELRDASNNVLPNRTVELGIIQQSVAKGDSRKHVSQTTGPDGSTTFSNLEFGAGFAYRVTSHVDDATFAAAPFNLGHDHGMHVVLHVYPVVHDLPAGMQLGSRAIVYVEVKDDRIQIQERLDVFNGTPTAWVPKDFVLHLPENFTALNAQQQMSDIGVDSVPKEGGRVHGTFLPGENAIMFSWQLPYGSEPTVDFEIGMPPNVRQMFVRAAAAPGMKLAVPGFREAVSQTNEEGQRELVTMKQLNDNEPPPKRLKIGIEDLPTPGPTRLVGSALAAVGILAGIYLATQKRARGAAKASARRDRERILDEVAHLERAHARGDVGPKTYERARRELVDELATVLATAK